MDNHRLRTIMATALLLIAGAWTVGARAQNAKQLEKKERGWVPVIVFTNSPVANADIVVSRPDGKVVFEKDHATNARGFYPVELHPIPKKFRVTVIWEPTRAPYRSLGLVRMSTDVNNYDRVNGRVYVNPVTTIVSRLLDRRPELSLARAQAIVRFVLGLPTNASLGAAMREGPHYQSPYFSESEFLKQAIAYGGFDSDLENLVTQAIYHPNERHLFRPPQNLGSTGIGTEAAEFVAKSLAQGALSYLAGQGVGWAGTAAGIFEPGATAGDIAQLQAALEDLQSSVDALSNQLTQSTAQIIAAINYSQYNTLSIQALKLAAQVDVVEQNVTDLADGCPPATSQPAPPLSTYCTSQKAKVAKQLSESEINASYEEFAAFLEDTATVGNKGLLHLFSLCMGQSVRFFRYPDSVKVQDMWAYWDAVETQAANLKVELLHLQKAQDDLGGQKVLLRFLGDASQNPPTSGELQDTHATEFNLVWPILPDGTVVNTKDPAHTEWATSYPGSVTPPNCKTPLVSPGPPTNQGGISTQPQSEIFLVNIPNANGLFYLSPTKQQMDSLIDGWTGANPNQWLVDQTSTMPGDPITAIPFKNVLTSSSVGCASGAPYVWTLTGTGSGTVVYVLDLSTGKYAASNSPSGDPGKSANWVFLVVKSPLQFYWYN